jgi:5-methyltetrahydrofolate--homocysteine methyltransferase
VGTAAQLRALFEERIVVFDGAWGTMIQAHGLSADDYRGARFRGRDKDVAGNPDVLSLTRPEVIRSIHDSYLDAGADVTTTNTFTATSI